MLLERNAFDSIAFFSQCTYHQYLTPIFIANTFEAKEVLDLAILIPILDPILYPLTAYPGKLPITYGTEKCNFSHVFTNKVKYNALNN